MSSRLTILMAIAIIFSFLLIGSLSINSANTRISAEISTQGVILSDAFNTLEGPVRGEVLGKSIVFRGIPYAAPPVGDLRWKPPQPPAIHSDLFDAVAFGSQCAQPRNN